MDFIENIDKTWTLFLDRDGVINKRLVGNYVKSWSEFQFLDGVLESLEILNQKFQTIVIVTNQQGVGKGQMTMESVNAIHAQMLLEIEKNGGRIDKIYVCPALKHNNPKCRKPETGMGEQAQRDFSMIDFSKSVILGDSASDIEFGKRLGMKTVFVKTKPEDFEKIAKIGYDMEVESVAEFVGKL
ncbi:MAG: D-glycero-D-manno-heptose 1,7-bisphosphate phosphatase [Cognaticolwellia sp.]|jgi:D-glycero-D-manno-heptose 1,7-bisphosphate phosphatase